MTFASAYNLTPLCARRCRVDLLLVLHNSRNRGTITALTSARYEQHGRHRRRYLTEVTPMSPIVLAKLLATL